jgi:hypothetical protein
LLNDGLGAEHDGRGERPGARTFDGESATCGLPAFRAQSYERSRVCDCR